MLRPNSSLAFLSLVHIDRQVQTVTG